MSRRRPPDAVSERLAAVRRRIDRIERLERLRDANCDVAVFNRDTE